MSPERASTAARARAGNGGAAAEPEDKHAYYIEALGRGLAVLDAFGPRRPELSLRDVAEAASVTQPSALRIGFTLVEAGYLIRNPVTKGYRLGPRAVAVGLATLSAMPLPEIAEPYLAALRDRTNETVKLAVPADTVSVVVAWVPSRVYPPGDTFVGTASPLPAASLGRAILAWQAKETIDSVLKRAAFPKLTDKSLTRSQVRTELTATRKRGYALNDQGTTTEHRSVAAPILAPSGHAVGAINVSVSALRYTLQALEAELAPEVTETAGAISTVIPPNVLGAGSLA